MGRWFRPATLALAEFQAPHPTWCRPLVVGVAESLAAGPTGRGAVFESDTGRSTLRIAAFPAELSAVLRHAAQGVPGTLIERPDWPRRVRPPSEPGCLGRIVVDSPPLREPLRGARLARRGDDRAAGSADRVLDSSAARTFPVPAGAWAGVQLRLEALEGTRLATRVQFAVAGPAGELLALAGVIGALLAVEVGNRTRRNAHFEMFPSSRARWDSWDRGTPFRRDAAGSIDLRPDQVPSIPVGPMPPGPTESGHEFILGSSGAGKTTYLAQLARAAARRHNRVIVFDVHGDLAPAIVGAVAPEARARFAALDASRTPIGGAGLAVLRPPAPGDGDREAAHLVAALKRLTAEGPELYWGFRLERVFDTFVRVVQDEAGGLTDLYELLTDERRRDAARLASRRPEVAAFLDELAPLVRRNPEFLWPAAARVAKVVLNPSLGRLLDPPNGGVPAEEWLASGGSILLRLPVGELGPEGAQFATTLLASRLYLALVARGGRIGESPLPVTFLFDEAHAVSPRVLAEILTEGRKFGVTALVATQYPERLAPEVRAAAAGAVGTHTVFRVPRAAARATGPWVGLAPPAAETLLPTLPTGFAVRAADASTGGRELLRVATPPPCDMSAWGEAVDRTARQFGQGESDRPELVSDELDEAIVLAVFALEASGRSAGRDTVVREVLAGSSRSWDPAQVVDRVERLRRRRYVVDEGTILRVTGAGERFIGLSATTGATRESGEHRALLLAAFRILAARGCRMEVVRQGRFDTRLPDGRVTWVPREWLEGPPGVLADRLGRWRGSWGYRYFHGRDVHVEAEVSGAVRPERIRRGLEKARTRDAFVLFLVTQTRAAGRIRRQLRSAGAYPMRATVWTLPRARVPRPNG